MAGVCAAPPAGPVRSSGGKRLSGPHMESVAFASRVDSRRHPVGGVLWLDSGRYDCDLHVFTLVYSNMRSEGSGQRRSPLSLSTAYLMVKLTLATGLFPAGGK